MGVAGRRWLRPLPGPRRPWRVRGRGRPGGSLLVAAGRRLLRGNCPAYPRSSYGSRGSDSPTTSWRLPGTAVAVSLTGLLPWDPHDDLYLFSASGGIATHFTSIAMDRPPAPGDTAVQAAIGLRPDSPLVEGPTRGDQLFVVQARHQSTGTTQVWSAGPAMATSRVHMSPGATAQLTGALEANPRRLTVEWDPRALLLRAAGDVRFLVTETARLKLSALPGSIVVFLDRGALLALASGDPSELPSTFEYTDPFPAAWSRILEYELRFRAYVPVSEQHQCWYMGSIGGAEPAVGDTVKVSSNLAPPRNVQVTSGSTPHVTWEMPDGLFPNGYMLTVYTIEKPTDPDCQATRGPRLFTNFLEARLPPGLVTPGKPAFVVVRAVYDVNFDASPFFTTKWSRYAEAALGHFSPDHRSPAKSSRHCRFRQTFRRRRATNVVTMTRTSSLRTPSLLCMLALLGCTPATSNPGGGSTGGSGGSSGGSTGGRGGSSSGSGGSSSAGTGGSSAGSGGSSAGSGGSSVGQRRQRHGRQQRGSGGSGRRGAGGSTGGSGGAGGSTGGSAGSGSGGTGGNPGDGRRRRCAGMTAGRPLPGRHRQVLRRLRECRRWACRPTVTFDVGPRAAPSRRRRRPAVHRHQVAALQAAGGSRVMLKFTQQFPHRQPARAADDVRAEEDRQQQPLGHDAEPQQQPQPLGAGRHVRQLRAGGRPARQRHRSARRPSRPGDKWSCIQWNFKHPDRLFVGQAGRHAGQSSAGHGQLAVRAAGRTSRSAGSVLRAPTRPSSGSTTWRSGSRKSPAPPRPDGRRRQAGGKLPHFSGGQYPAELVDFV